MLEGLGRASQRRFARVAESLERGRTVTCRGFEARFRGDGIDSVRAGVVCVAIEELKGPKTLFESKKVRARPR